MWKVPKNSLPSRAGGPRATGSRRRPGPAGPPAALTGGLSAAAMTPLPSSQEEGRQRSLGRRATSRGSHRSEEARKVRPLGLTALSSCCLLTLGWWRC